MERCWIQLSRQAKEKEITDFLPTELTVYKQPLFPLKSSPTFTVELHQSFVNNLYFQINPCYAVLALGTWWHLSNPLQCSFPIFIVDRDLFFDPMVETHLKRRSLFYFISYLRSDLDLAYRTFSKSRSTIFKWTWIWIHYDGFAWAPAHLYPWIDLCFTRD